jgi:6-pyruvoyltetrahydropterin/6-carboxytetrahydropterin synthase
MSFTKEQLLLLLLFFSGIAGAALAAPAFHLGIRDSFMIAHSFHGHPSFGPAGGLHGATYTCDVEFAADELHPETNWVIDIGKASELLAAVLARYNYKNLDEIFANGDMTTTEFMCRQIHSDLCERLKEQCAEFQGDVCVKLWESHKAWASYSASV